MSKNVPRNHHYVPQHYLKAWESSKGTFYSYRINPFSKIAEVKKAGIKRSASEKDLYHIEFYDGSFEIENSIINPYIDDEGAFLVKEARDTNIANWGKDKKYNLARYIVCLEARHPNIIEKMNIDLTDIKNGIKKEGLFSEGAVNDVFNYFETSKDIGVIALSALIQNEKSPMLEEPFTDGLNSCSFLEFNFSKEMLICSNYPTGRWGHFLKDVLLFLALSPTKAIIYAKNKLALAAYDQLPKSILIDLINLYTLGNADVAYYVDDSKLDFISKHLGWAKKCKGIEAQREYVGCFLDKELPKA